jgi:hypothetical protein
VYGRFGVGLLLLSPTTPLLMLAGLLTGSGAAFITTPTLVGLTRAATDADEAAPSRSSRQPLR